MAAEGASAAQLVFLDTRLIVAATVEVHPQHDGACEYVDRTVADGLQPCVSLQVVREFLVVLTRQPVSGRVFDLVESLAALEVWMTGCWVREENHAVLRECLDLVRRCDRMDCTIRT